MRNRLLSAFSAAVSPHSPVMSVLALMGALGALSAGVPVGDALAEELRPQSAPIAVRQSHACAVGRDGKAYCWGQNGYGQLGDGSVDAHTQASKVFGLSSVVSVAVGGYHSCALINDGTVRCWGNNASGQLGGGKLLAAASSLVVPFRVEGLTLAVAVSAGTKHSCALTANGQVYCWGQNSSGELGDGKSASRPDAQMVQGLAGVVQISAGDLHTCAVTHAGEIFCWGYNSAGQLGTGDRSAANLPKRVNSSLRFTRVAAGSDHTCAIDQAGAVHCWGANGEGQLGMGAVVSHQLTPVQVLGLRAEAVQIALGSEHSCALLSDHTVQCWGVNGRGQLGAASPSKSYIPVSVEIGSVWHLSAGGDRVLAAFGLGGISGWGDGERSPVQIKTPTPVLMDQSLRVRSGPILLVTDPAYVDGAAEKKGNKYSEPRNLLEFIETWGRWPVAEVPKMGAGALDELSSTPALILPEQEKGELTKIATVELDAIRDYVAGGGVLVVGGSQAERVNGLFKALFSWNVEVGEPLEESQLQVVTDFGWSVADLPPVLKKSDATYAIKGASLPRDAKSLYTDSNRNSFVALMPYQAGLVVYLGWDWYDAKPLGSVDGGWLKVLEKTLDFAITKTSPAPESDPVGAPDVTGAPAGDPNPAAERAPENYDNAF